MGSDTCLLCLSRQMMTFQSTLPRGERPPQLRGIDFQIHISIHAPAWGATFTAEQLAALKGEFQSTLPRGERHNSVQGYIDGVEFQSTLPRGERHESKSRCCRSAVISIHAPAWGATRGEQGLRGLQGISIHAPAWGATGYAAVDREHMPFQSTLPRGERPGAC